MILRRYARVPAILPGGDGEPIGSPAFQLDVGAKAHVAGVKWNRKGDDIIGARPRTNRGSAAADRDVAAAAGRDTLLTDRLRVAVLANDPTLRVAGHGS